VDEAQKASDTDKEALGFLPERAYKEAADQGKLLIAIVQGDRGPAYAGHLLYGGVFPQAKIFQIFTVPQFRRNGIGRRLVEAIVRRAESLQFMSVLAQVADDLTANTFWEHLGFEIVRTKKGGRTTGRQINVRVRELDTPRLFRLAVAPSDSSPQDLKLSSRLFNLSPIYVLDLNILFDLVRKRANVDEVGRIVQASFNNLVRLAVTDEFIRELERTSTPSPTDPILELARRLPRLQAPPSELVNSTILELGSIVFPDEVSSGTLRAQDRSDLVHLATAIHCKASGFVTSEKAILRARSALESKYSLEVVGASEFADRVEPTDTEAMPEVQALSAGQVLQGRPMLDGHRSFVEDFLVRMRCPQQLVQDVLRSDPGRPHRSIVVTCEGSVVAFGIWDVPSAIRFRIQSFLCVDEDHSAVNIAADFLLDSMSRESLSGYPIQLSLRLLPGHVMTKRMAAAHGFGPDANESSNSSSLQKIAVGCGVTANNWAHVWQQLKKGMGVVLPDSIPSYQSLAQPILIKGPMEQTVSIPLEKIETLLSPVIFFLPDRPGAIVPIRKVYAADLIGGAKQLSFLASPEAVLLRERVYFSHPRTTSVLTKGIPVLFYESGRKGGSASVIAAARVIRTEVVSRDGANQELLRRGVLDRKSLKKICLAETVVATTIDNIMLFKNPVRLEKLRAIGAIDGANLITARSLKAKQLIQIVEEGVL
jgi:GNAT superfamily N-acetyltransferase/predicted nucleic acid-binding protein